jgi:hypothetical protein
MGQRFGRVRLPEGGRSDEGAEQGVEEAFP